MKKLKTFDRVMLVLLMIAVIACSVWGILLAWGFSVETSLTSVDVLQLSDRWQFTLTLHPLIRVLISIVAVFLVFVAIRILFVRKRDPKEVDVASTAQQPGIMLRNGENGAAYITKDAIQHLVDKQVRADSSIRDAQSQIDITPEQNVKIQLKISVMADQNLPEVTSKLQESLKSYIESTTGIAVESVEVLIAAPEAEHHGKHASKGAFESKTK